MTFTAYIERQKSIIRNRHDGEIFLIQQGEAIPFNESEKLLNDLSALKGLNTFERSSCTRAKVWQYT